MSNEQPPTQLRKAIRSLLLYLREHPEAKDTLDGVKQWWLCETSEDYTRKEIQGALDWLTVSGCLTRRETGSTLKIYGLKQTQRGQIEVLLAELNN